MLGAPEEDPARAQADRALLEALTARLTLGPAARFDAETLSLRALLAGRAGAEAEIVRAVHGRLSAAARPLVVCGSEARTLAADRFGLGVQLAADPDAALKAANDGARALIDLATPRPWWGRLLALPGLRVVAALPDSHQAQPRALLVSNEPSGPTGEDRTFWITDDGGSDARILDALSAAGLAAQPLHAAGGLKLFSLAGYVQREDGRLIDAPGQLTGVIGAAPLF